MSIIHLYRELLGHFVRTDPRTIGNGGAIAYYYHIRKYKFYKPIKRNEDPGEAVKSMMKALGSSHISVVTLFVEDLQRAVAFYQEAFGLEQVYEDDNSAVFDFGNMSINLLEISEAHGLIDPGTVASPEAGSRFQFTIRVEDVDAACADLQRRGVELLNGPMNRPWGIRSASFVDPGGHIWEIAQELA